MSEELRNFDINVITNEELQVRSRLEKLEAAMQNIEEFPRYALQVDNALIYIVVESDGNFGVVSGTNVNMRHEELKIGQELKTLYLTAEVTSPDGYVIVHNDGTILLFPWDGECTTMTLLEYYEAIARNELVGNIVEAREALKMVS